MDSKQLDRLDFAYVQGIIDELKRCTVKDNIMWGGYRAAFRYILAPENASSGTENTNDWEQVGQYGSDLGEANADPIWEQPGRRSARGGSSGNCRWFG